MAKLARDLKRKNVVKFVWVEDGDVFLKVTEESRAVKLKSIKQINEYSKQH